MLHNNIYCAGHFCSSPGMYFATTTAPRLAFSMGNSSSKSVQCYQLRHVPNSTSGHNQYMDKHNCWKCIELLQLSCPWLTTRSYVWRTHTSTYICCKWLVPCILRGHGHNTLFFLYILKNLSVNSVKSMIKYFKKWIVTVHP